MRIRDGVYFQVDPTWNCAVARKAHRTPAGDRARLMGPGGLRLPEPLLRDGATPAATATICCKELRLGRHLAATRGHREKGY